MAEGRNFMQLLDAQMGAGRFVCVGLDPDSGNIPGYKSGNDLFRFCAGVIDATKDVAAAFKPNSAFFESHGMSGLRALESVISYIQHHAPDVPVILDIKRGDIGNTNEGYAVAAFDRLGADAVTIHGYMGREAMSPFLDRADKGVFVLVRTSNKGSDEFQNAQVMASDEEIVTLGLANTITTLPLYQRVAHNVANHWNVYGNCGVVAGATYPDDIVVVRQTIGDTMPILIPGVGSQGGDLEASVMAGKNSRGQGFLINSSRGIIFAEDPGKAARDLHEQIQQALAA